MRGVRAIRVLSITAHFPFSILLDFKAQALHIGEKHPKFIRNVNTVAKQVFVWGRWIRRTHLRNAVQLKVSPHVLEVCGSGDQLAILELTNKLPVPLHCNSHSPSSLPILVLPPSPTSISVQKFLGPCSSNTGHPRVCGGNRYRIRNHWERLWRLNLPYLLQLVPDLLCPVNQLNPLIFLRQALYAIRLLHPVDGYSPHAISLHVL